MLVRSSRNVRNLAKINERELSLGFAGVEKKSWHQKYKDSAWIFFGGVPYELTEGDLLAVFSQLVTLALGAVIIPSIFLFSFF